MCPKRFVLTPSLLAAAGIACAAVAPHRTILPGATGITVLDAPSNLGLRPPARDVEPGAKRLPDAIRATGLLERLDAEDMGAVPVPSYRPDREPETGYRNGPDIAKFSRGLAARIAPILDSKRFAFVLGGDCSVLLGSGLALRERGRYGLAFIDGHDDYSSPRNPPRYAGLNTAAGRDLALVTGTGPRQLTDIDGKGPYFRTDDVIHIGLSRTEDDRKSFDVEAFEKSGIAALSIDDIERHGADQASVQARELLEQADTKGFWIHLDADVLDATIMPAVDSPNPHGMTFGELQTILTRLLASPKAVGMELTIFDPTLDPDGRLAEQLADVIERAFVQSGRARAIEHARPRQPRAMANETAFSDALFAHDPAPGVAGNADIFAPLLGAWDLDVVFYDPDGKIKKRIPGEWHFARTLEGRAIEDVWIVPPRKLRDPKTPPAGEYGETVRFYDPRIDAWHSVWLGVVNHVLWPFIGRRVGKEIVLERMDDAGLLTHWVFFDMRSRSFKWRSETSNDGGKSWRVEQRMWATRQAPDKAESSLSNAWQRDPARKMAAHASRTPNKSNGNSSR